MGIYGVLNLCLQKSKRIKKSLGDKNEVLGLVAHYWFLFTISSVGCAYIINIKFQIKSFLYKNYRRVAYYYK